ncbi:MAG: hypothetical protein SFV17_07275 [Candidatus Obscuribacter sp.]|nr:hypothetical protein [Candidatus Obscuribacter sp.]
MSKYRNKLVSVSTASPVLVVIDMQKNFTSDAGLIQVVEQEITFAVESQTPVVIVDYKFCGDVYQSLLDVAQLEVGSELRFAVTKNDDNGAAEILGSCRRRGISLEYVRICGVNTNACVLDTTMALARQLPRSRVELLGYACRNSFGPNDYRDFVGRNIAVLRVEPSLSMAA